MRGDQAAAPGRGSAGREVLRGVESTTVSQDFKVHVGSGGTSGASKTRDGLALLHDVAGLNLNGFVMRVAGGDTFAVLDLDHLAVCTRGSRKRDDAARNRVDIAARPAAEVDALVPRRPAGKRVDAGTVARRNPTPFQWTPRRSDLVPEVAAGQCRLQGFHFAFPQSQFGGQPVDSGEVIRQDDPLRAEIRLWAARCRGEVETELAFFDLRHLHRVRQSLSKGLHAQQASLDVREFSSRGENLFACVTGKQIDLFALLIESIVPARYRHFIQGINCRPSNHEGDVGDDEQTNRDRKTDNRGPRGAIRANSTVTVPRAYDVNCSFHLSARMPARKIEQILSNRHSRQSSASHRLATLVNRSEERSSWTSQFRALLPPGEAARFEVANIRGEHLTVHATSAAWATRLRFRVPELLPLLRRLNDFSKVEHIHIRATHQPTKPT